MPRILITLLIAALTFSPLTVLAASADVPLFDCDPTAPYLYTGENLDSETNFIYLRARYYDPATGRFISRDPVRGTLESPLSQNSYVYALDNPVAYSDPSGLQALALPGAAIGSFFGPVGTACGLIVGGIAGFLIGIWAFDSLNSSISLSQSGSLPTPQELVGKTPQQIDDIMRGKGIQGEPSAGGGTRYPVPGRPGGQNLG